MIGSEGESGGLAANVTEAETTAHWFGKLEGGGVLFVGLGFGASQPTTEKYGEKNCYKRCFQRFLINKTITMYMTRQASKSQNNH